MTYFVGQKRIKLSADFETTTDLDDCRVWAWGVTTLENPDTDFRYGNTLDSFIKFVKEYNSITYFHNLRFDGTFILDWLLKKGYKHTDDAPAKGEFSTLIDRMNKFYSITVNWGKYKTEFRDSYKRMPLSVSRIAKSYKLDILKGELDYKTYRPIGHKLTEHELAYLKNDVVIVATALHIQEEQGMSKLTVGADALAEYKRLTGAKEFNRVFPVLSNDLDAEIRKAYRGGFTYASPKYQNKVTGAGKVYDVNSLYPSVMYDRLLPWGEPIFVSGAPDLKNSEYPLWITSVTLTAKLKKNHIPCIQIKGSNDYVSTVYQEHICEPVTLYCTNVDFALWNEHYDIDILMFNGTWHFQGMTGLFKEYIDKWMHIKANSEGGIREISKLFLNSLYGKFATNPDVTGKYPILEDDRVKLVLGDEQTRNPVYTAMGVFITAYARDVTIRAAQKFFPQFAYADTDSLHLVIDGEPEGLNVHPSELGAWKHEMDFVNALFVRAKTYSELDSDGVYHNHVAGLPVDESAKLTFDSFKLGEGIGVRLTPKTVPGGIVLVEESFTLKT